MTTYGVNEKDGTLSICRAKPENRGLGRCHHVSHDTFKNIENISAYVKKYNETKMEEHYGLMNSATKPANNHLFSNNSNNPNNTVQCSEFIPQLNENKFQTHIHGKSLTREEFDASTEGISHAWNEKDWKKIKEISQKLSHMSILPAGLPDEEFFAARHRATHNIEQYLHGNSKYSVAVREYLGHDVDLHVFADILVNEVHAMTKSKKYNPRNPRPQSFSRIVGSTVGNDMTKERYIASILFFGGRCCYCNKVMNRAVGKDQATGEHITPMNPKKGNICGGTRFGNMALACSECNQDRGSKDLHTWVRMTKKIPEENKKACIERIETFRKFALYTEYTAEQSDMIQNAVENFRNEKESWRKDDTSRKFTLEERNKIAEDLKILIFDLNEKLRESR